MACLMLRLDAPLMSFGGVLVDQHNPTDRFPGRSMLTGLLANALGWHHRDTEALNALQARIQYAARWDVPPQPLRDYHTVDLGQEHLANPGWTTHGIPEHREGGSAKKRTHQRNRHYWANGVMTVALVLEAGNPDVATLATALRHPARPLFIGRKACLPAGPLLLGLRETDNAYRALADEPRAPRAPSDAVRFEACWPPGAADTTAIDSRAQQLRTDDRNWRGQAHVGLRPMVTGYLTEVPPCT